MDRFTCLGMDLLVVVKQVDYMRRSVGRLAPPFSTKKRRMSFCHFAQERQYVECKSRDVYFRLLSNMNCHLVVEYVTECHCIVWYLDCTVFQKRGSRLTVGYGLAPISQDGILSPKKCLEQM